MADKTLDILLRLNGDTSGVSRVKDGIAEIRNQIDQVKNAGSGAEAFGTALGIGLSAAAAAGVALYNHISSAVEAEIRLNEETLRQNQALDRTVSAMMRIGENAKSLDDQVRIGEKAELELAKLSEKLAEFRARELNAFSSWGNTIESIIRKALGASLSVTGLGGLLSPETFQQQEAGKEVERTQNAVKTIVRDTNALLDEARQRTEDWAKASADPAKSIQLYNERLVQARGELSKAEAAANANPEDQAALARRQRALENERSISRDLRSLEGMITDDTGKQAGHQSAISTELRNQANLLAQIRGQQQLVAQNPFLSADQKNAAMVPLITKEIAAMNAQIERDKALLRNSALDPAQYVQVVGGIQRAEREVTMLGQKLKTLSFAGGLRADLTAWVNQFGTTAHQVAGIITGTLNTAIASTSQALTSLIFHTGNWKQAFAQAAQAIVQNIIQIALQWVVSRTLMSVLNRAFGSADQASVSAEASGAAASWAPAAVAASTASYGAAAGAGLTAYLAALATGQASTIAAAGTGFESGGFTGGREGRVAGVVHGEEFVFSTPATRVLGIPFLESLHSSAKRGGGYERGGYVGARAASTARSGGGPLRPVFIFVNDLKEAIKAHHETPGGQKHIVDIVNGHRVELGLA